MPLNKTLRWNLLHLYRKIELKMNKLTELRKYFFYLIGVKSSMVIEARCIKRYAL